MMLAESELGCSDSLRGIVPDAPSNQDGIAAEIQRLPAYERQLQQLTDNVDQSEQMFGRTDDVLEARRAVNDARMKLAALDNVVRAADARAREKGDYNPPTMLQRWGLGVLPVIVVVAAAAVIIAAWITTATFMPQWIAAWSAYQEAQAYAQERVRQAREHGTPLPPPADPNPRGPFDGAAKAAGSMVGIGLVMLGLWALSKRNRRMA